MPEISEAESTLMKNYIGEHCGLFLGKENENKIGTQLSGLVKECGCENFGEFHAKFCTGAESDVNERIIDLMTTKESYWFRDRKIWNYLFAKIVPVLINVAKQGNEVKIWSAGSSTGQEAFSFLIMLSENESVKQNPDLLDKITILATDISNSVLFRAISARYDKNSIAREVPEKLREKYFTNQGITYNLNDNVKKRVKFIRFNLLRNFKTFGKFDLIFCRYVSSFYNHLVKKDLFNKLANALDPGGMLVLGKTESVQGYTDRFDIEDHSDFVINKLKNS